MAESPWFRAFVSVFGGFREAWRTLYGSMTSFDVTYHVRRSALPKPGTEAQLRELVGRIMSRPLDRSRPLWEMYLVEGLRVDASRS